MNFRRGFRRVALVLWVAYALVVVTFPFFDAARQRKRAFESDGAFYRTCEDIAAEGTDPNAHKACDARLEDGLRRHSALYSPLSEYRGLGWNLLWALPLALFVPPLILYGMARGLVTLGSWIAAGFRESTET